MIGQTVSHYKILEELGRGGMGVVYKAEDTKLKRTVALKFLPPELTRDKDAKTRFIHEAQAASALQHHNICTIHEIDETDDERMFIVMDCYEGETVKAVITRGPLVLDKAIDIVSQVAEGLAKAHESGMVHRDIKPANILVTTDAMVKILDFGLAKLAGQTKVTKTGTTVGTMAYMSPEQAMGKDIDHRSDVFSLGALFHEMLAGEPPFKGDHEAAVLYGIAHNDAAPLAKYRADVPEDLQRIVDTMLCKDPGDRYQNASEVARDLSRFRKGVSTTGSAGEKAQKALFRVLTISAVSILTVIAGFLAYSRLRAPVPDSAVASRKMIAVLPFDNLGPAEDDYFAAGITDAITARLAVVHGLGVISRRSVNQYKETTKSLREIGRELGVEYVMEGTVQRERQGDPTSRVRVIPQLIRVADDTHLWADTFANEMSEVFDVQSDIAENVAEELGVMLLASERRAIKSKPTDNLEAYEYYLAGRDYESRRFNITDAQTAVAMYSKAVEIDPEFSSAWASLAQVQAFMYLYYSIIGALPGAVESANKAFELEPESAETQMALGYIQYYGYQDYDKAFNHVVNVLERQPSNTDALNMKGSIHRRRGEWQSAVANYDQMIKLDPRDYHGALNLARCHLFMRSFNKAEHALNRAIAIDPATSSLCYEFKAFVSMVKLGSTDSGENIIRDALRIVSTGGWESTDWIARLILVRTMPEVYKDVLMKTRYKGPPMSRAVGLLLRIELDFQTGRISSAISRCDSIETLVKPLIGTETDDASIHCMLGLSYSKMGRKSEAVAEGKTFAELLPVSRDAVGGAALLGCLAEIYVRVGEYDKALDLIEYLATIPSLVSSGLLNCDPIWEPLRDHPRFERILEKL